MKIKYKILLGFLFCLLFSQNVLAEETVIELETDKSTIDIEKESFEAKDGVILKYGNVSIRADQLKKMDGKNILLAYGNVVFKQGTQVINAKEVIFDIDTKRAKIIDSESYDLELKLRYGGKETISEYPNKIIVKDGWFTTSSYEKPNYKVNAEKLSIYPNQKIVAQRISVEANKKKWLTLPYYVASLKNETQRATLFPYIGSDSKRGLFGIWGFDYDKGNLAKGFVDFEVSTKKKMALKFSNDYILSDSNSGNVLARRYVLPIGNNKKEWDFEWNHNIKNTPKKSENERKFYDLGYGIWNLNYRNITTNLIRATDGVLLDDDYKDYVSKYKDIGFYDLKVDQELGKKGEFNLNYYWTENRAALRDLTKINDNIAVRDKLDPRKTDVDLYRSLKYKNGDDYISFEVDNEDFVDINPGYIGDLNSYRKKRSYSVDLKGSKIKLEYLNSDKDEYGGILNLKEHDEQDDRKLKNLNRWVKKLAYDKKKNTTLTFGNYYPFRKDSFFGYRTKETNENLLNNLYFGVSVGNIENEKKEYDYDYTRDNGKFNKLFLENTTEDDSRIYKLYEDSDVVRNAKKIIYEKYRTQKLNIGNDKIEIPIPDSYISFNYGFENRNYSDVLIPKFENGRKIEDVNSKTGYKVLNENAKQTPKVILNTFDTKLFTTIFNNTSKKDNKYDVKITNEIDVLLQKVKANEATYEENDIIEIPTNVLGLQNDFKFNIGNIVFNYNLTSRKDKHFKDNWTKNSYNRNFVKTDIGNKRFVSFDFENNKEYELKDFKSKENKNREIQYGYISDKGDNFLYKYSELIERKYPKNEKIGWNREIYKESLIDRSISANFNEWGVEYTNIRTKTNDIFGTTADFGTPHLKLKTNLHKIGFIYDTTRLKNKSFESDHYVKLSLGFGRKTYRDLNNTPLVLTDDKYLYGDDYTTIGMLYRYENNAKTKYKNEEVKDKQGNVINDTTKINIVNNSNTKQFSIKESNRNSIDKIEIEDDNRLFLNSEEETKYKSYVENETYKQNKFNLNDFNSKLQELRKNKKYFQVGIDLEIDGNKNLKENQKKSELNKINDFTFKMEMGYLDKFFTGYKFIMERPSRNERISTERFSSFNYRKHEFEGRYVINDDPDKPWWVGQKLQYVQNGAPKLGNPEIYESSSKAVKVNKLTLGMATFGHRAENLEWEFGMGMKWDKPDNKKLGYYPVVTFKFGITPFPEKNAQIRYSGGRPSFGVGF